MHVAAHDRPHGVVADCLRAGALPVFEGVPRDLTCWVFLNLAPTFPIEDHDDHFLLWHAPPLLASSFPPDGVALAQWTRAESGR